MKMEKRKRDISRERKEEREKKDGQKVTSELAVEMNPQCGRIT